MTRLADLPTPSLILDREILDRNIARMSRRAGELGVPMRPHGKTPKSVEVAKRLVAAGASGLTVSTLAEAEAYHSGGISDLFYAVAMAPQKVARAGRLIARGADLTCLVDHPDAARLVADAARAEGFVLPMMIELDVDGYRAGLRRNDEAILQLARFLHETPGTSLAGVMSYGGASYGCTPIGAMGLAERHRRTLVTARDLLFANGLPCPAVSFGSTPATLHAVDMTGVTELRCGIYMFQDLFQMNIGACSVEDIALSVLATIIGHRPDLNRIVVDAGALAMSKDSSTAKTNKDLGFGLICEVESGRVIDDVYMALTSQELGLLSTFSGGQLPFDRLPIGSRVRVLPNHADMTAAAYQGYHVVAGGDEVEGFWERANGW